MAKNTGDAYRRGAVKDRSQVFNPKTETWVKRNDENGRFMRKKMMENRSKESEGNGNAVRREWFQFYF